MPEQQPKTALEIIQALMEPFDACELEFKIQPFAAVYIDARTPVYRLNAVLPGEWSFRLVGEPREDGKGNISRDGCLTLFFPSGPREYGATGTEEKDNSSQLKAEKGADSDAFKRCCFRAGIGAYIYELPKEIKQNVLTEAQVTQAARLTGYAGPIRPSHFGAMNKARAVMNETKPAPNSPAPNGNGSVPKEKPFEAVKRLCGELQLDKAGLMDFLAQRGQIALESPEEFKAAIAYLEAEAKERAAASHMGALR